ncbi:hypothetical protein TWF696_003572 [Orbilia brochopaga]
MPPTVMVVPGKNMGIRPTNHVDTNGRCYHPYLAYWSQNPDKSSLIDLCGQLKDVFSKEPPLYSKQPPPPGTAQQPSQAGPATPPPLPPLPQEIEAKRARGQAAASSPHSSSQQQSATAPPPPPPPKAELQHQSPAAYTYTTTPHLYLPQSETAPQPIASAPAQSPPKPAQAPPDRPALPQKVPHDEPKPQPPSNHAYQQQQQQQQQPAPPPLPPHPSSLRNSTIGSPGTPPQFPGQPAPRYPQTSSPAPALPPPGQAQHVWPARNIQQHHAHRLSGQYEGPVNRFSIAQSTSPRPMSFAGYPAPAPGVPAGMVPPPLPPQSSQPMPQQQQQPMPQSSQTVPPKPAPKPRFNLLDSDDAGMIPASSLAATPAAVPPPLPPNPEKDRLINEIAKLLQQRAEAASAKTKASLEQTASQAEAMAKTEAWMERERLELARMQEMCEKDQRILGERIGMADELIREVRDREAPNIDGVVVAPTVVHNQLYELVTDDMAIEDTIYVLGKALDKERITLDIFLKHTRALAREQFMKRALVKKISRKIGMT